MEWIWLIGSAILSGLFVYFWEQRRSSAHRATLEAQLFAAEEKFNALRAQVDQSESEKLETTRRLEEALQDLAESRVRLEKEQELAQQRLKDFEKAQSQLSDTFKALASDTLKASSSSFLELAQSTLAKFHETAKGDLEKREASIGNLVKPVHESLSKFDQRIQDIEKARVGAYESLTQQVKGLMTVQDELKSETRNLVKALANPKVRGRWGEIQLKRVVELSGMMQYCDFDEQKSFDGEDGAKLRPDMIVKLPLGKTIVVDSKAPLASFLSAMETSDEDQKQLHLRQHAKSVRSHVQDLSRKSYWSQFKETPEFVVMFIPGDSFYNAALEVDPELIEYAVKNNVIPATPTTLISLLKAVSYGWRQETLAKNAQEISELGKTLYERIVAMSKHFGGLGSQLDKAVDSYNKTVRSLESRVLVTARKFNTLAGEENRDDLDLIEPIETSSRALQSSDLSQQQDK